MRILFFIDAISAGGKERRMLELMKGLKARTDMEFQLVVLSEHIHYPEVYKLGIIIHHIIRKTKRDFSVFRQVYTICKSYRPDFVHCWDGMSAVYLVPALKLLRIKLVNGMVTDTPVKRNIFNKYWLRARLTFPFSSIIIGNSKAGLAAYNAPKKKSACIYNGIDLTRFDKLSPPSSIRKGIFGSEQADLNVIGMVAAFEERKDYRTLIKAAVSIISENDTVRFVLIGDGTDFNEIKDSVPAMFSKKIIFLGKRSDVESIINVFDIGILLTNSKVHGEGISNSIIEYMALAKPVIATRGGGTNEVVIDNENGYLIDAANEVQLKEKIESLIGNKSCKEKLGNKGNAMVHSIFDLKIMTSKYVSVYQNLLNKQVR